MKCYMIEFVDVDLFWVVVGWFFNLLFGVIVLFLLGLFDWLNIDFFVVELGWY